MKGRLNNLKTWPRVSVVQKGQRGSSRNGGWSCGPGPPSCCGLRRSLDHPEWLPEQELPFSSHLVCCCLCLFGFSFFLTVSFIFTFGGFFLLPKLTKNQTIRLFYWIKYMHVPCSGLPKMGGSRSNIIDLQIFFWRLMLLWLRLETALKQKSWSHFRALGSQQACLHIKKINRYAGKIGTQLWRQRLFFIFQSFLNQYEDFLTTKAAQHPPPLPQLTHTVE